MFKFNMYAAMSHNNPWYGVMNSVDQSDEEQDSIKVCMCVGSSLTNHTVSADAAGFNTELVA